MNNITLQAAADALDRSIREVGESEFNRLSESMSSSEWTRKIGYAFRSLSRLQQGEQPDYDDEWVALFYLLWYQPKQINLAYSTIKQMILEEGFRSLPLTDSHQLHIMDFGCGSLAMQFAIALTLTDELEMDNGFQCFVDSIDRSQVMISVGGALWSQFELEVQNHRELENLNYAMRLIEGRTYTNPSEISKRSVSTECWLSAIHAVYDSNKSDITPTLELLESELSPTAGFITHFADPKGRIRELARSVSPFKSSDYNTLPYDDISPQFTGELLQTTEFRRGLIGKVHSSHVQNYLRGSVTWEWNPAGALIYTKRG